MFPVRIKPGRLLVSFGILIAALVAYNVLILVTARASQRHALLRRLQQIPADCDCLLVGNSLMEAGCDLDAFRAATAATEEKLNPINIALGATSPVEHYLILKRAVCQTKNVKCIVYGFFDDQLNSEPRGDSADLVGNRAFSYYFPADAADLYAPGSSWRRWEMTALSRIPMFVERSSVWGKVEMLRRSLSDIGMPKHQMNRFGRVEDFSALEMKDAEAFNQRCRAILDQHTGFSRPVQRMLSLAREHGATFVFVEMPMPSHHRNTFYSSELWPRVRETLQANARKEGALYIGASDWIADDDQFEDATHLNEKGAQHFSGLLAKSLSVKRLASTRAPIPAGRVSLAAQPIFKTAQ